MRRMRLALWVGLVLTTSCGSGTPFGGAHACGLVGCGDQFTATVQDANGSLPSGAQALTVMADGVTTTCSFTLPLATDGAADCPSGLQVLVLQAQTCVTSSNSQTKTQSCTPVAGKFAEIVTIAGKPATIHFTQTVNGATALDQTLTPAYTTSQPNGPGCDPVCTQASAMLALASM
jgi:hypothetical protein